MRHATVNWSWGRRLAPAMVLVLALSLCRTEAGEDQAVTVSPGTDENRTFSAEHAQPLWTLTVTPASGWAHQPATVNVNSSRWIIEDPGGGCEMAAFFECDTATQPAELQFQDRIFSGQLEPCTSSPGGTGGSIPGWQVTGKTSGDYRVLPESTNICLGSSATFHAMDCSGNPVQSSWSSNPSVGTLDPGSSVGVTPSNPGAYTITGTSLADTSLFDVADLAVIEVEITAIANAVNMSGNGGYDWAAFIGDPHPVFGLTSESYVPSGVTWSIIPPGVSGGATINDNGNNTATVDQGQLLTNYTIVAVSKDNTNCLDTISFVVICSCVADHGNKSKGTRHQIPLGLSLCPPPGTKWSTNDLCGNTLEVYCTGSQFELRYNQQTVGWCSYGWGINIGEYWLTTDGCSFHSTSWTSYDNTASGPHFWPFDEGTPDKWDWQVYRYDCIQGVGREWCLESDTDPEGDDPSNTVNSANCEDCGTTNGCHFTRQY